MTTVALQGESYWAKMGWKEDKFNGMVNEIKIKVDEAYKEKVLDLHPMLENAFKFDPEGKQVNGGGWLLHVRIKQVKFDGSHNTLPEYVDKDGEPWDEEVLIGNGSKVRVGIEYYKAKRASHPSILLRKVQVDELASYDPDGNGGDDIDMDDELI